MNDRNFPTNETIEQRGLAYIRPSDNRQRQAFMHDLAVSKRRAELFERPLHIFQSRQNLSSGKD